VGLLGGACSHVRTRLSLQIGEMQGDQVKMQGAALLPTRKTPISKALERRAPYSMEQGAGIYQQGSAFEITARPSGGQEPNEGFGCRTH